ncbi:MAG: DUF2007 domain-containing protein [Planctomycetota bacterium]
MSQPLASVVRIAKSSAEAHLFVAMLQSAGIPAYVEGESLADEFAMSRKLMNLGGTSVMVPTSSLARAQEILAEGERESRAATDLNLYADAVAEQPRDREDSGSRRRSPLPAILGFGLAVVFLLLWVGQLEARARERNPLSRYEPTAIGLREIRIADGVVVAEHVDAAHDGHYEKVITFAANGGRTESLDEDGDLRYERHVEYRGDLVLQWVDTDRDGLFDACTVKGPAGEVLQELHYDAASGFVLKSR